MPAEKECAGSPAENRKSSKPIMEKRRRARINASLCELKSLLLEVMKKEGARHNKMEKADILEMTVKHLRQIQRQQFAVAAHADPTVVTKYQTGFAECAHEVTRYLSSVEGVDVDLKSRMLNHLANTVTGMVGRTQATSPVTSPTSPPQTSHAIGSSVVHIAPKVSSPVLLATGSDVNNNTSSPVTSFPPHHTTQPAPASTLPSSVVTSVGSPQKIISGVQLIPTRLPNGEVAFVLPSNVLSNGHVPGYVIPVYSGAPTVLTAPLGAQTKPSTDVPQLQTVLTPNLPVTPTGSAQPTVLPAVLLPSVATVTKPCTTPDPLPMNLTSSQTPTSPGDPPRTLPPVTSPVTSPQQGSEVKVKAESLTPGQPLVAEDVIRDKVAPPVEEDNVWRPW